MRIWFSSQSPKSMTLAFSCPRARPSTAIENDIVLSFSLATSSVKGNVNLPFALHVQHKHTLTHTCCSARTSREEAERESVVCRLACLLGGSPKKYATLLCRASSARGVLSVFASVSVFPPLFRTWTFYGICVTQPSTLECVNFGTFYGILMLNMTAILYLFYLPTHAYTHA